MINARRGEIRAEFGGRSLRLCLTLGALAELETALGVNNIVKLGERLRPDNLSAGDLLKIIGAGVRGGGNDLDDTAIARLHCEDGLAGYARIAAALLAAAFPPGEPDSPL